MVGERSRKGEATGAAVGDAVEIVRLAPDEWAAYRALRLRALAEEPQAFGEAYANAVALPDARWRRRLEEARPGADRVLLFARRGERLVGMIAAMPYSGSSGDGSSAQAEGELREARIISVFVAAEERGRGTGARLMEAVLRSLKESGRYGRVSLTVNKGQAAAVGLYRHFGFESVGELDALLGDGAQYRELIMERALVGGR